VRPGALLLSAAILVCAFAYGFYLLWYLEDLSAPDAPRWYFAGLVVALAAAVPVLWEASWPARRARQEAPESTAPERLWHLCAPGVAAWLWVLVLFGRWWSWSPLVLLGPVVSPRLLLVAVPAFLLFSMGIGILAIGKAKSRGAKWIVALANFSAPAGYALWWMSF